MLGTFTKPMTLFCCLCYQNHNNRYWKFLAFADRPALIPLKPDLEYVAFFAFKLVATSRCLAPATVCHTLIYDGEQGA